MKKRFALYPGNVVSKTDGDNHFISAMSLVRLYKINHMECMAVTNQESKRQAEEQKLIKLYPRYDGDYSLPERVRSGK